MKSKHVTFSLSVKSMIFNFEYKCGITIDKFVSDPIFQVGKKIYTELTSQKIFAEQKNYGPVEEFPL
jgi:hypothetical protein